MKSPGQWPGIKNAGERRELFRLYPHDFLNPFANNTPSLLQESPSAADEIIRAFRVHFEYLSSSITSESGTVRSASETTKR